MIKGAEVYRRMSVQNAEVCMSKWHIYEWVNKFENNI